MAEPTISIVVPNFNGGATIGRTLESLIAQDYPGLEILVVDGGSSDQSVEIIRRYERHLAWWISEKDRGQSHAINKGLARCTGRIVNWLCSDDYLLPDALHTVARYFQQDPSIQVLAARTLVLDERAGAQRASVIPTPATIASIPCRNPIAQPSCFFLRELLDRPGPLDESLNYVMDFDLWAYFVRVKQARWVIAADVLATFVMSGQNKTSCSGLAVTHEHERVYRKYFSERVPLPAIYRHTLLPFARLHARRLNTATWSMYLAAKLLFCLGAWPFYGWQRPLYINLGI